ncbi:MAG: alpha/beta fold hydrolase [Candidatus Hydrogenedentes bacterium]|nr:alpha/beta fold hydrolase [Candidatus Hydrogenedentota bacterium]
MIPSFLIDPADRNAPRDPQTGVMRGSEARDLGPEDAPNAVLFVHGFAGAGNNFNDLPERLAAKGWRVRVMRLPGHGTSPRDLENVTADELLSAVVSEATTLREKHTRVVLVGHSMGGALSTLTASRVPVDGIVLGGAYFGMTDRWYYGLKPERWTTLGRAVTRWVYKGRLFTQVNRKEAKKKIVSYTWIPTKSSVMLLELARRVNEPSTLSHVTCPVLMVHSHGDVAASAKAAERAFNAMASTKKELLWFDRSNHHIYWDYDADKVAEAVEGFCEMIEGSDSVVSHAKAVSSGS